ncbi:MAG: NADH-quinone oxidoreductase subunit M [Planctomycetia bacterium]|nr:NADH-quinone oxidoreductase subunit M [Planctomycetia bacterium]
MNLLATTILIPLVGVGLIWALSDGSRHVARWIALATSLVTLYWAAKCLFATPLPACDVPWFTSANVDIRFNLGLDGLSLWMFGLSALLSVTAVLVSWEAIEERGPLFYSLLLILETGMLGVFAARDVLLFYVFFEFTLIPLFFLIGIWGSEQRRYAAVKFFLFTLAGSMLTFLGMLAIVALHYQNNPAGGLTFSIPTITQGLAVHPLTAAQQFWIFLALFAGFAIKVPLFPLHTWLPLAHVQAPTAGSVLLAGILLKIGTYGFLRFNMAMLPDATVACMPWVLWLAAGGIIYGALVALAQGDVKRLIAYSSVSHLGYCMLGLFALNPLGMQGGVLQMINHGISTGGLFAVFGMIYERYHSREINKFGGLAKRIPILSLFMLIFTFSSIGLPGMNGFTGEFMILLGIFQRGYLNPAPGLQVQWMTISVLAVFGVVLGAWYMLWLYQRVFFGPLREPGHEPAPAASAAHASHAHDAHSHDAHGQGAAHGHDAHGHAEDHGASSIRDMSWREFWAVAPLVVFVFWIGLKPQTFLAPMQADIGAVTTKVEIAFAAHQWPVADHTQVATQPMVENPAVDHTAANQRKAVSEKSASSDKVEDFARVE